ncbi:MAG: LON peptidase substrate-binding domain-containing protein [Actinobacteria bacterium]|nr:LON peptidase substrate-binding domain-containing protein [Actinomycetota bacterium]
MFPLGAVLFPTMVLPLHVFELRYRQLVHDCLDGENEPEFGVVLIERGSEVGGGDVRSMVGTVARIVETATFDDGRWALGCVGTRRIRVVEWQGDDPYPKADVVDWDDPPATPDLAARVGDALRSVRKALAMHSELGDGVPRATVELSDDPVLASYQLAAIGPFGPADRQHLLAAPDPGTRVERLAALVDDDLETLRLRLAMEGGS